MPSLPSPEPTVSCFDDIDFFNDLENEFSAIVFTNYAQTSKLYHLELTLKDFENEFPAIVYNDAQTSKSDLSTEPILNPQHIDELNLKDETSLSECDKEEQNVRIQTVNNEGVIFGELDNGVINFAVQALDNPNITMEEYIRLEEEKVRRRSKVYNWETTTYGKIWDNEDVHDLRSVETEFPAISFNDTLTSEETLSCEPTINFFNDLENEFLAIVYNDAQTSKLDDLDYFKDFENEFPAIFYNDAQTSKSDLSTEPILNPQHIDELNLKDETSLSECDKEEQNVLCFNDLYPFNVIYLDKLKSDEDNNDDKINVEHSLGDLSVKPLPDVINTDVVPLDLSKDIKPYIKLRSLRSVHWDQQVVGTTFTTLTTRLPILNPGEYDL
ncbi:hypothetical protein Tco_1330252 [Tanacetum coccineum]